MEGKKLTASLDIYAFGIMMYEVATCQQAYQGRGSIEVVVNQVVHHDLRPSWSAKADVPPEYRSAERGGVGRGGTGQVGRSGWGGAGRGVWLAGWRARACVLMLLPAQDPYLVTPVGHTC